MVSVVTDIYSLQQLAQKETGKLIKNENVYNLIMTFLFKKTKIKAFLLHCIQHRDSDKIKEIERKSKILSKKPI